MVANSFPSPRPTKGLVAPPDRTYNIILTCEVVSRMNLCFTAYFPPMIQLSYEVELAVAHSAAAFRPSGFVLSAHPEWFL